MESRDGQALKLAWLVKLRWGAIAGQLVVFLAGDRLMHVTLPLLAIFAVVSIQVGSNLACAAWARRAKSIPEGALAAVIGLDCLLLTALLLLSGEDSHPFAVLYLVNVALAGMLVRPRWTWALAALSLVGFTLVFALTSSDATAEKDPPEWQLREAWLAFGVSSALLVYFLQRTTRLLREREQTLEAARQAMERREKLASLATLAAGAAHELGTPLSTIALVAKELEHRLEGAAVSPDVLADAKLIRAEVERCRAILAQLGSDAGANPGEALERMTVSQLMQRAVQGVGEPHRVQLEVEPKLGALQLVVPPRAVGQALIALLTNALQASADAVVLRAEREPRGVRIDVADRGPGMEKGVLAHAGEPFFSTKGPGRGMGLGLFLSRSILEQLGGQLLLESAPAQGTTVSLLLPPERLAD